MKKWGALLLIGLSVSAMAQKGISVKLYSHASLFDAPEILGFDEATAPGVVTFGGLAAAVLFQSENGLYQEVELSRIHYKDVQEGSAPYEEGTLSLRYEAGYLTMKNPASKMRLRFGMSLSGYTYMYSDFTGAFEANPIDQDGIGWIIAFTPHLEVNFTKHLFFDFSPYLDVANFGIRREYEYDPNFADEQIDSIDFLFAAFRPRLRAGFGWHF